MLSIEDKKHVTDFLNCLSPLNLSSLASTVTGGVLSPESKEEAVEMILLHSKSVESILNRKRITRHLLFRYLDWKKVPVNNNRSDKDSLVQLIVDYWKNGSGIKAIGAPSQLSIDNSPPINEICSPEQQQTEKQAGDKSDGEAGSASLGENEVNSVLAKQAVVNEENVNLMALQYAEWFFSLLNRDFVEGGEPVLGTEHFWQDASMVIRLRSGTSEMDREATEASSVVNLICDVKSKNNLYFSPNQCSDGIRGRLNTHGVVLVLVCGTLHQAVGQVVGVFEQIFYLVKDPLAGGNWKIKRTEASLRSVDSVAVLPTLHKGELTKPFLALEQ